MCEKCVPSDYLPASSPIDPPGGGARRNHSAEACVYDRGNDFLIVNRTHRALEIESQFTKKLTVEPVSEVALCALRQGALRIFQSDKNERQADFSFALSPDIWGIEVNIGQDLNVFETHLLTRRPFLSGVVSLSSPIDILNLFASTENALKRQGILTLRDAIEVRSRDTLLVFPKYRLKWLFDFREQLQAAQLG